MSDNSFSTGNDFFDMLMNNIDSLTSDDTRDFNQKIGNDYNRSGKNVIIDAPLPGRGKQLGKKTDLPITFQLG